MFGKRKRQIKELQERIELLEMENKQLKDEIIQKDKKIDLMYRSMKAVNIAKGVLK